MIKLLQMSALLCALLLATSAAARAQASDAARCYSDWSEAAGVVRREALVAVDKLGVLVREQRNAEILKTTLCQENGRFVYRLVVKEGQGGVRNLTVDARKPVLR